MVFGVCVCMVESQGLDDLRVVTDSGHMEGGGAFVVEGVGVRSTVKQPFYCFVPTYKC